MENYIILMADRFLVGATVILIASIIFFLLEGWSCVEESRMMSKKFFITTVLLMLVSICILTFLPTTKQFNTLKKGDICEKK